MNNPGDQPAARSATQKSRGGSEDGAADVANRREFSHLSMVLVCSFDVDPLGVDLNRIGKRMSSRMSVVNCFIAMGVARKACLTVWLVSSSAEHGRMPCRPPDNSRISARTHLFGVKMMTLWSSVGS